MYASSMKLALLLALAAALCAAATGQSLQTAASLEPAPSLQKAEPSHGLFPAASIGSAASKSKSPQRVGTGGDLVLLSQVNGAGDPWAERKAAAKGDRVFYGVHSPGLSQKRPLLLIQLHRTGAVLRSPYPGIAIDPSVESFLTVIEPDSESPMLSFASGFNGALDVPAGLEGWSMLMQGFSRSSGARNEIFESTDAHEIVFE